MIAIVYARVSTEEQAKHGYSLGEQISECRKRSAELQAEEIVECVDEIGGDFLERPGLDRARQLVRSGRVGWFVCLDPDRFSRNLMNQLLIADEIERYNVQLVFLQHNYETTPEGRMFFQMRGVISEFEKSKILERTKRGKRGKLKRGELPGYCEPYGYSMDSDTDKLVVNEEQAKWVRQIFAWASDPNPDQRLGQYRIAERLNQMGVSAPRGDYWYRATVAGILKNRLYTGTFYWGKFDHSGVYQNRKAKSPKKVKATPRPKDQWMELAVPTLITPETFERVREYIDVDKRRRSRGNVYMLTGIGLCGLCGGHMQTKQSSYRYLVCSNRYPQYKDMSHSRRATVETCSLPHLKAERVESFVWSTVCGWIRTPSSLRRVLEDRKPEQSSVQPLHAELELVSEQLQEAERAQERVLTMVARANVRPEIAERQINNLSEKIQALEVRRKTLQSKILSTSRQSASISDTMSTVEALSLELKHRLDQLSDSHRVGIIRRIVSHVVIGGKSESDWSVHPLRVV